MAHEHICEFCNSTYTTKHTRRNQRFCSKECFHSSLRTNKKSKTCPTCGCTFAPGNKEQKFCSIQCYWNDGKSTTSCAGCGQRFKYPANQKKKSKRKFCSRACYFQNAKRTKPVRFECDECGAEFFRKKGVFSPKSKSRLCSRACTRKWYKRSNPSGSDHPEYNSREVPCANCGTAVLRPRWRIETYKNQFCSKRCAGEWRSQNISGADHPRWKGGKLPYYGPDWRAQSAATRKRDGYRCQHCGMTQAKAGRKLDVHHIKPFRDFEYVPDENTNHLEANQLTNLVTLCRECHKRAEARNIPIQPNLL